MQIDHPVVIPLSEARYLMVEDNPADAELFSQMIHQATRGGAHISCVDGLKKALAALRKEHFEALILDMNLPDGEGTAGLQQVASLCPELPIVILTGSDDEQLALETLHLGAQDYLCKNGVDALALMRALRYATERKHVELKLKQALQESAQRNLQLESAAKYDGLTGLPNRSYFQEVVELAICRAQRDSHVLAVLYFDLNGFKNINDLYGHTVGDALLKQVGDRIQKIMRGCDFVARVGGDEFVVLADSLTDGAEAFPIAQRIQQVIDRPIQVGAHSLNVSVSIGIAVYPDGRTVEELVRYADLAMYEAKNAAGVRVAFYSARLDKLRQRQFTVERALPQGLLRHEFQVLFQPIVAVASGHYFSVEALSRWESESLGEVHPDEFIPIIEAAGVGGHLIDLALHTASAAYRSLAQHQHPLHRISLNVCGRQLASPNFVAELTAAAERAQLPLSCLCLEITERQVIGNLSHCHAQLKKLQSLGVHSALDDYGTGFSSITHLKSLPINYLKIDRSLIDQIDSNLQNLALTAGVIEMAHRLDMEVVAEGVERHEEWQTLKELGCDYIQGFLVCVPLAVDDLVSRWN